MKEYDINVKLANEVHLQILLHSPKEHKWIFNHRLILREENRPLGNPLLINDTRLDVNYDGGNSQECELFLNIERPDRRGKVKAWGVDISAGSHLNLEIVYQKEGNLYRAIEVLRGIERPLKIDGQEGLIKNQDLPFPLKDRLENENGIYRVPFLKEINEQGFFEFPERYCR